MRIISSSLLTAVTLIAMQGTSRAALLAYEGFDYGLTNNTTIHGATSTASGFGAGVNVWSVTNVLPGGGAASSRYQTSGLTFSNLSTTAGALLLTSTFSGTAATTTAGLQLSTSTTGTLWNSHLVRYSTLSAANNGSITQGIATTAAGAAYFRAGQTSNQTPSNQKLVNGYDSTTTNSGNFQFVINTTYLVISKYTNVGTALSPTTTGVGTSWVLTTAQYDAWQLAGGTEALLNNSLYYSARAIDAAVTSGQYDFNSGTFAQLRANAPNINGASESGIYDEIRYGTDLSDVIAVPEPSTGTVLVMGLAGLFLACRGRRSTSRV